AVFLVDLDGFKRVNDTLGHAAGDDLICQVSRRIVEKLDVRASLRFGDARGRILARLGGDELVFIDPHVTSEKEAKAIADEMLALVASGFDIQGHYVAVTASIGVALVAQVGHDIDALLHSADAAMYEAKARDRNNACFYSDVLSERARTHREIETALRSP